MNPASACMNGAACAPSLTQWSTEVVAFIHNHYLYETNPSGFSIPEVSYSIDYSTVRIHS
jgi:hypothetical protein